MLPRDERILAVDIQKRSYKLIQWLAEAMSRGFISVSRAHGYASAADAALDWISEHYGNLPREARPDREHLRLFSNYFGSYVTTSFDLLSEPGVRLESRCGCYCAFCSQVVNASHLKAKKPGNWDKKRAEEKCVARVRRLAAEAGLDLSPDDAVTLVTSTKDNLRNAAYSAYGQCLLERINGDEGGLYVLALWRMFAWKPEGSPIKGFTLEAEDVLDAEQKLLAAMQSETS